MNSIQVNKIAQLTGNKAAIYTIVAAEESKMILSGSGEGWIVHWDLENPENGKLLAKVDTNIFSLLYLPQINHIVAGNMDGGVHWVDLENTDNTKNIAHHQKGVFDIQEINGFVYTAGGQGNLTKWSIEERRALESLQISNQSLRAMAYSPSKGELAIGASDHRIYFLDLEQMEIKNVIQKAHSNSVFTVKYSPDEQYLMSGGRDAMLKIWDLNQEKKAISAQPAHWFTINDIAFHPKGHIFATASRDKTIKIWDSKTFKLLKVLDTIRDGGHINSVNKLYWSSYNKYLLSCSDDRSIIMWEVND